MTGDGEERRRMVRPPTRGDAAGRGMGQSLKTADDRTLSSQQWLKRQLADPYVKLAKTRGFRSRAAFKLLEIDDRFHLIRKGSRVIDLGCAPGGWMQAALERGAAAVVGVDLLPVEPLPPADIMIGDFADPAVGPELMRRLGGAPDLVLSDLAPNTTGHRQTDHLKIIALVEAAMEFAIDTLKPGGAFVTKAFQGGETAHLLRRLRQAFTEVKHVKPKASRADSSELYLVATGFKGG